MTYIKYTVSQHPLCHKIPEAGPYDSCLASLRLFSLIFTALSTETWAWSCCAERVSRESVSCDISPRPLGVLLAFADGYSSWSASSCIRMCHFSPKGFVETSRSTLYLLYICRLMSTFVIFSAYQDVPPIRKSFKPNTSIYCSLNVSYALSCISYLLLHNKILPEFNSLKQQPLCLLWILWIWAWTEYEGGRSLLHMAPAEAVGCAADWWALLYQDPTAGSLVLSVGFLILLNVASSCVLLGLSHSTVVSGSRIS